MGFKPIAYSDFATVALLITLYTSCFEKSTADFCLLEDLARLELATSRLEDVCSIQLNYKPLLFVNYTSVVSKSQQLIFNLRNSVSDTM